MTKLTRLFQPISIGGVELRNRVVMPAMSMNYGTVGAPFSDRLKDFYLERANGGVGLIIMPMFPVYGLGSFTPAISDEELVVKWRDFIDALHQQGAKVGVQIVHPGKFALSAMLGYQPISPSSIPSRFTGETPRELTIDEIKTIVENFAEAVVRAKNAGFDLIEYNCCSGYLIREFLSPLCNHRTDEYGGSLENRLRFFLEIIERSRERAGEKYPLTCRLSAAEFLEGGYALDEAKFFARELERAGLCAISVVGGGHETRVPLSNMSVPRGAFVYLAQGIKEVVGVPVVASARINDPLLADRIIGEGKADLVAIGRALIADPEFVIKAEEGRFEDIVPCIACNQGCFDLVFIGQPVFCLTNARAGRERELEIKPASERKKVIVVGGGPGGMEVARVSAMRGHTVSLYEKGDKLGGQLNLAAVPPGREEFAGFSRYLSRQLEKLKVEVFLQREFTPEMIAEERPDVVVVATGALPLSLEVAGIDKNNVVQAWDVLAGKVEVGPKVAVIGGGSVGCETALFLAKERAVDSGTAVFLADSGALDSDTAISLTNKGRQVCILELQEKAGRDIGVSTRWTIMRALRRLGVEIMTGVEVEEITTGGVRFRKGGERQLLGADTIVIAVGSQANDSLYHGLAEKVSELYMIGDCKEPRKAADAIREAFEVGCRI